MKPTDEIDDLLTRAGARWRADQEAPPEPDLEYMLTGGRKPRRRWVPALAAASVAVVAAGVLTVLPSPKPADQAKNPPTAGSPQPVAQGNQANDELLVKPGDKVQVSGLVIAAPGKTPVFCPVEGGPDVGYPPGKEPAPTCPPEFAVTLTGVDLDRLSEPKTTKDVRSGRAKLVGIWGGNSIDVREQSAPDVPVAWKFPPVPCPPPAGGWVSKPSNVNSPAVTAFLAAHGDQIFGPVIHYPNGTARNGPVVIMVGVAHGDLAAFRRAFEKAYSGNLCVAPVLLSRSDNDRIVKAVTALARRKEFGVLSTGGSDPDGGRAIVSMVAYTPQVKAALTPIGLKDLQVAPVVKPVR
jgi:hypothetical protein